MTTPEDIAKEKAKNEREIHNRHLLIGVVAIAVVCFIVIIGVTIGLVVKKKREIKNRLKEINRNSSENRPVNKRIVIYNDTTVKDPPLVHNVCDKVACNADMRNWISSDDNTQFKFGDLTVGNCKYCDRRAYRSPLETSLDGGLTWQSNVDKLSTYNRVAYVI